MKEGYVKKGWEPNWCQNRPYCTIVDSLIFIVIRYLNGHVMWCSNIAASLNDLLRQLNNGNSRK